MDELFTAGMLLINPGLVKAEQTHKQIICDFYQAKCTSETVDSVNGEDTVYCWKEWQ